MDIVKIEDLKTWREEHPDAKGVTVDHGIYGYSELTFNYANPLDKTPNVFRFGAYDCFGNFHFIDSEGTHHKCLNKNKNNSIYRKYRRY